MKYRLNELSPEKKFIGSRDSRVDQTVAIGSCDQYQSRFDSFLEPTFQLTDLRASERFITPFGLSPA